MRWSSKQHILQSRLSRGIGDYHRLISTHASTTPQRWHISTGGHTLTVSVSNNTGTLKIRSWVTATHIPGILNVDADTASRQFNPRVEWTLASENWISENSGPFLSPGGRSVCIMANPPGGELCLQISRSGGNSSLRFSPRLEQVEEFHTPSCEPSSSGCEEDPRRESISPGDSTKLAQHALVPTVSTDVVRLPPAASNVEVSIIPPIRPPGPPSSVGNPQPGGMAIIRRRFETAGFSPVFME